MTKTYDEGEAKAIVRLVLEKRFGLSMADIICGKVNELSANDKKLLEEIIERLEKAEPVQYVLGEASFYGRNFHVEPGVLIPRPETAELCKMIIQSAQCTVQNSLRILDIGTGSGCIAITLALEIPHADVTAWDISNTALQIARNNAEYLGAKVTFQQKDILSTDILDSSEQWDVIVSNPPYICQQERQNMADNVLQYEPEGALFVPDEEPLLFYRAIACYAKKTLKKDGRLFFELNPLYAEQTKDMLDEYGCSQTEIISDQFGKQRFTQSIW